MRGQIPHMRQGVLIATEPQCQVWHGARGSADGSGHSHGSEITVLHRKSSAKTLNTLPPVNLTGHLLLNQQLPLCHLPPWGGPADGCAESWQGLGVGWKDKEKKAL